MSSVHPKKGILEVSCYLLTLIYIFWINRSDFWVEIFVGFALIEENMWIFTWVFDFSSNMSTFHLGFEFLGQNGMLDIFVGKWSFCLRLSNFSLGLGLW